MAVKELLKQRIQEPMDPEELFFWDFLSNHSTITSSEANTKITIHTINYKSTSSGPGIRTELFLQGCYKNCEGCFSPETHDVNSGDIFTVLDVLLILRPSFRITNMFPPLITICGGEPLLQQEALATIIRTLKEYEDHSNKEYMIHILLYTGLTMQEINDNIASTKEWEPLLSYKPYPFLDDIVKAVDAIVDGPYVKDKHIDLDKDGYFIGSGNQNYHIMKDGIPIISITAEAANFLNGEDVLLYHEKQLRKEIAAVEKTTDFLSKI